MLTKKLIIQCAATNWVNNFFLLRFNFHNVTGLSPNKEYRFRVFADNFYGRSEACEPTAPVKTEEPEAIRKKKQLEGQFRKTLFDVNGK